MESGTIEQTLPGLESEVPRVEMTTGHAIPLAPRKRLMVFAGRSHPELAAQIAERLGVELGEIELTTFANGETYCRYCESIRGADVFIVQTGGQPVDQNIMELLFMIQAAKLASAKRITAVVPWFPYSRQDRKAKPREPISARLLADMIQGAGADRLLTMDLHAGQIQGFFNIPVDHLYALPVLLDYITKQKVSDLVVVSPDGSARYWDLASGEELRSWQGMQAAVSPDGSLLAFQSSAGEMMLIDPASGEELRGLETPASLSLLSFSPEGKFLAGLSPEEPALHLWGVPE